MKLRNNKIGFGTSLQIVLVKKAFTQPQFMTIKWSEINVKFTYTTSVSRFRKCLFYCSGLLYSGSHESSE